MAALILLQAAAAPATAADADIVVTAQKLRRLRISTQIVGGKVHACEIRVTSGDADIDRVACEATRTCFNGGVTDPDPLADCVDSRVAAFVQQRRTASSQ